MQQMAGKIDKIHDNITENIDQIRKKQKNEQLHKVYI